MTQDLPCNAATRLILLALMSLMLSACAGQTYYMTDGRRAVADPLHGNANQHVRIYQDFWRGHRVYQWHGGAYWCVWNCTRNESPLRGVPWPTPDRAPLTTHHNFGPPIPINRPSLDRVLPCLTDEWCTE